MSEQTNKNIPVTKDKNDELIDDLDEKMITSENHDKINENQVITDSQTTSELKTKENGDDLSKTDDADKKQPLEVEKNVTTKLNEGEIIKSECIVSKVDSENNDSSINDDKIVQETQEKEKSKLSDDCENFKRKSSDDEEQYDHATKIPRTLSSDDAFTNERNKLENTIDSPGNPSDKKLLNTENTSESSINKLKHVENGNSKLVSTEKLTNNDNKNENDDTKMLVDTIEPEECKIADSESKNSINNDNNKKRMSIEVVFDKSKQPPSRPKELVEIDEDGEKIILDSSQENSINGTSFKLSPNSDNDSITHVTDLIKSNDNQSIISANLIINPIKQKFNEENKNFINLISDSEGESFSTEDLKSKDKLIQSTKEITFTVKLKILCNTDELTNEIVNKEILSVNCEADLRRSHSDHSCLGDTSDKDSGSTIDSGSPMSSTEKGNLPFPLPKVSRQSILSTISSSSSSSTASIKIDDKKNQFCLPQGLPKHTKRVEDADEVAVKLNKEWKNINFLTTNILQYVNTELITQHDIQNGDPIDEVLKRAKLSSSTPEVGKTIGVNNPTPKNIKKTKITKKERNSRLSRANGTSKDSPSISQESKDTLEINNSPYPKTGTPSRSSRNYNRGVSRNQTPIRDSNGSLDGKKCFAKWSTGNMYYPAKVACRLSEKRLKVVFLDGKDKTLNEDLVIPMPEVLNVNLEIHVQRQEDKISLAVIKKVINHKDDIEYTVETNDGQILNVKIDDILMTSKQIRVLQEESNILLTPHVEKKIQDNIKNTPKKGKLISDVSTPKSVGKKNLRGNIVKISPDVKASSSGIAKIDHIETDDLTGDSSVENDLDGIQQEISDMPNHMAIKGPQNRLKGSAKRIKKKEDPEIIAELGPIPETGSTLFKGMSFIIVCAPLQTSDKSKDVNSMVVDSNSEPETDNELEWSRKPLLRERLSEQLIAGGGKVYKKFQDIPIENYADTKLITNIPNSTENGLLCLSVGIRAINHRWVIRCCQENKLISSSEEELPSGWSLEKKSFIEFCQRTKTQPLAHVLVAIPKIPNTHFMEFWTQIIHNAGGKVLIIDNSSESFEEATIVLSNNKCPSWAEQKAISAKIPLVSCTWIKQCLIEGKIVPYEQQLVYQHNYTPK